MFLSLNSESQTPNPRAVCRAFPWTAWQLLWRRFWHAWLCLPRWRPGPVGSCRGATSASCPWALRLWGALGPCCWTSPLLAWCLPYPYPGLLRSAFISLDDDSPTDHVPALSTIHSFECQDLPV